MSQFAATDLSTVSIMCVDDDDVSFLVDVCDPDSPFVEQDEISELLAQLDRRATDRNRVRALIER